MKTNAQKQKLYRKRYRSTVGEILDKLKQIDQTTLITKELTEQLFNKKEKK